jgi:hypothetical protein
MLPQLSINIIPNPTNPLEITFRGVLGEGLSSDSFVWDFGDGQTSTNRVAGHTYAGPGIYFVTLTALIEDLGLLQLSNWFSFQTTPTQSMPILTILESKLGQYLYNLFQAQLVMNIQKWQVYLQPQVEPPLLLENTYIEANWPPLWNYLIADLARLDLLMDESAKIILNQALQNSNSTTSSDATGAIKRVETGPAQVEFHPDTQKDIDAVGQYLRYAFEAGRGMVEQYKNHCCVIAKRLHATLPFCPGDKTNFLFLTSKPC